MEDYSIYSDFESYVKENQSLIAFLSENNSLLDEYISPIIKTLTFLINQAKEDDNNVSNDSLEIFEFGYHYLFENLEQLKLYLRQLNNDYSLLEKMSLYIKIVFNLEDLRVELNKSEEIDEDEKKADIKRLEKALEFFEENIVPDMVINEFELDKYLDLYYELLNKYPDIVLMSDAFNEYCATYGI